MAEVLEYPPHKAESLSSSPRTITKTKKKDHYKHGLFLRRRAVVKNIFLSKVRQVQKATCFLSYMKHKTNTNTTKL
jgi:hypothetical protein